MRTDINSKKEASSIITGIFLALLMAVVLGANPVLLAKLIIVVLLNFLAIPLALVWSFPIWVWYIILIYWLYQIGTIVEFEEEEGV